MGGRQGWDDGGKGGGLNTAAHAFTEAERLITPGI